MIIILYNDNFLYFETYPFFFSKNVHFIYYNINSEVNTSCKFLDEFEFLAIHFYRCYIIPALYKNKHHLVFKLFINKVNSTKTPIYLRLNRYDEKIYTLKENKFFIKYPFLLNIYIFFIKRPTNEYYSI